MIEKNINYDLLNNIFKQYKPNYSPIINEYTHNYVYTVENEIVAFVIYFSLYENLEIIDVFVIDKFRNKNIATKLLNKIIEENSDKNITLEVSVDNIAAIKLYEKLGFSIASIRKNYYKETDGYLMVRSR